MIFLALLENTSVANRQRLQHQKGRQRVDFCTKFGRVRKLARHVGWFRSICFEIAWSTRRAEVSLHIPGYPVTFCIRRTNSDYLGAGSMSIRDRI
jgi:hypothetical protein